MFNFPDRKHFFGTTFNAVKIQVYVAIITFCLVAILQHDMKLELTTYEVLHVLSVPFSIGIVGYLIAIKLGEIGKCTFFDVVFFVV